MVFLHCKCLLLNWQLGFCQKIQKYHLIKLDEETFLKKILEILLKLLKVLINAHSIFDDTAALTISALAGRARRLKRMYGLDVLFIDYLQLIRPSNTRDSRVNEISEITQGLKSIAKELNIPVVALSQLSRQVESRDDKRPQLSDLRESGSIEQDSDVVMFIFREEYYKEREKPDEQDIESFLKWQEDMSRLHGLSLIHISRCRRAI